MTENAVSTLHKPDLQQFTQDEIAAFCCKLEDLHGIAKPGGMIFVKARQIIRQLQEELAIDDLSAPVFTSPRGRKDRGSKVPSRTRSASQDGPVAFFYK